MHQSEIEANRSERGGQELFGKKTLFMTVDDDK
jgi:hypothetical protein